jgi:hypothetical protein
MITWAYIAGFLDGDGWVTSSITCKTTGNLRYVAGVTQSISCEKYMQDIRTFLIERGISVQYVIRKKNWKSSLRMVDIRIGSKKGLLMFLPKIIPYLLIKKELAKEALRYIRAKQKRRAVIPCKDGTYRMWANKEVLDLKRYVSLGWSNAMISKKMRRGLSSITQKISKTKLRNSYVSLQQNPSV